MKNFEQFGIKVPEILLPKNKDLKSWSVVACDQYTQDEAYWNKVKEIVGENPSTLNLILPEVYLNSPEKQKKMDCIKYNMEEYLNNSVFDEVQEEFIYLERTTAYGRVRKGLVVAIDLDTYEWKPFSKSLIRATEATIVDRIPPRKEIRRGALIESPHIMLLVNDKNCALVEKTGELVKSKSPLYQGDLMQNSGSIKGWAVSSDNELDFVYNSLEEIKKQNLSEDGSVFMFAVGDGNHSLATAKSVWDEYCESRLKTGLPMEEVKKSPVRYALVEIVNIYDECLTFEPIHRVLFNADSEALIQFLKEKFGAELLDCKDEKELEAKVSSSKADFGFVYNINGEQKFKLLKTSINELAVSRLQPELDEFISKNDKIEIDYIHGSDEVFRLGKAENAISIMLPPIAKDSFFETINGRGPLPRKSFSMGEASEKRFYLECRKLFAQ